MFIYYDCLLMKNPEALRHIPPYTVIHRSAIQRRNQETNYT